MHLKIKITKDIFGFLDWGRLRPFGKGPVFHLNNLDLLNYKYSNFSIYDFKVRLSETETLCYLG
jgi:hypothetical protein